jgi:aspartate/tyrosine/aromatic aminotransferase
MERVNRIVGHLPSANVKSIDASACAGFTDEIKQAPADAILGVKTLFLASKDPRKINVSIGAYRTDEGKPLVLQCVKAAEQKIASRTDLNKEYLAQSGDAEFCSLSRAMLFGEDCVPIKEGRVATVQTLSGTGSLRVGAEFIRFFFPNKTVYTSSPTWGTHNSILTHARVNQGSYRYWDAKNKKLDFQGMIGDINNAPAGSIFILHACAHNPTGVDPTEEQWMGISAAIKAKGHICWFDSAYQGFASGCLDKDAFAIRTFVTHGHQVMACQSYAKNFGLYGERIGTFSVINSSKENTTKVMSQLNIIIRNLYSNPPIHGAQIVKTVLKSPELTASWRAELKGMSERILAMRASLRSEIEALNTPGDWSHITSQIGMFSYTGLSVKQSEAMIDQHSVFMLKNGRISMAGVTSKNVKYLAQSINAVVTGK